MRDEEDVGATFDDAPRFRSRGDRSFLAPHPSSLPDDTVLIDKPRLATNKSPRTSYLYEKAGVAA